jgi:hypothetical protein
MEAGKAVYNILTNDSALALIVGAKIYPEIAQQDQAAPYVTYTVDISDPSPTKDASSSLDEQTVTVYGVSENYAQCMDIGIAVRAALDRNGGAFAGVQVQSIDFNRADVDYNYNHNAYVIEHAYTMRVLRVGNATEANIASVTSIYQVMSATIRSEFLAGGATPQDFNSSTPQAVKFSTEYQSTGNDITLNGSSNAIAVAASGWYRISYGVDFKCDTAGAQPSIYVKVETRELTGEASAYIPGDSSLGTAGCNGSRIEYLTALDRIQIQGYDRSDTSATINMVGGFFIVERIN